MLVCKNTLLNFSEGYFFILFLSVFIQKTEKPDFITVFGAKLYIFFKLTKKNEHFFICYLHFYCVKESNLLIISCFIPVS